jgi:hypothetical protein
VIIFHGAGIDDEIIHRPMANRQSLDDCPGEWVTLTSVDWPNEIQLRIMDELIKMATEVLRDFCSSSPLHLDLLEHGVGQTFGVWNSPTWVAWLTGARGDRRRLAGSSFNDDVLANTERLLASVRPGLTAGVAHRDSHQVAVMFDAAECESPSVPMTQDHVHSAVDAGGPL